MKIITFVIHEAAQQNLLDKLAEFQEIKGCFVTPVHGYFEAIGQNPFETQKDLVDGFTPRVRIEVLIEKERVKPLLEGLLSCLSCAKGRGIWWVKGVNDWGFV